MIRRSDRNSHCDCGWLLRRTGNSAPVIFGGSIFGGSKRAGDYSLFWEAMALGVLGDLMQHQASPRNRLIIECARASVDPRTVRKLLAGQPVRPLAAERAARVIARLNLTPEMFP